MTTKQKMQEHIHDLHKKHYAKKKARQTKKTEKADQQRIDAGKSAQVDAGGAKTAGVEVKDTRPSRATLMAIAQKQSIKYFRILKRDELIEVLALNDEGDNIRIERIQDTAKLRWKAGWGAKKKK